MTALHLVAQFGELCVKSMHPPAFMWRPGFLCRIDVCMIVVSAGLIGWVPNTDTLHALIREFRDVRKIPLNVEHRLMLGMAPNYDNLTIIQKVEVFEHALESTPGELLAQLPLQTAASASSS